MSTSAKVALFAAAVLAIFFTGFQLAAAEGDARLKAYQLQAAEERAEQGRKDYEKLVSALDEVESVRTELDRVRGNSDRMRRALEDRLRRAETGPECTQSTEYAACLRLLKEGVELLSEGRELVVREAARGDALSAIAAK